MLTGSLPRSLIMSDARLEFLAELYLRNAHSLGGISFEFFAANPEACLWCRARMAASEAGQIELALRVSEGNRSGSFYVVRGGSLFEKLRHRVWPRNPVNARRKNAQASA